MSRRDATRHDATRHDATRHDTTRHDTTRHNTTRRDTTYDRLTSSYTLCLKRQCTLVWSLPIYIHRYAWLKVRTSSCIALLVLEGHAAPTLAW